MKELPNPWPGLRALRRAAHATVPAAVQAPQTGAFSFLTQLFGKRELLDQVQKALRISA
ncbi:MAG TPA: hypothetical protein VKQ31_00305 [Steroidobacteraceae bacterium]|nr:hypothetical protein [Steroidobacteraceae bacterium]